MIFGIIALIVIVLIVLWGVSAYNGLVTLRNRVKNGWAQIDVQLKQRADLIPNLVETVKGYAAHESQVFTQVTQARASALQAAQSGDVAQRIQAENQLSRAIMNLQAVAEAYPQLQANQNFGIDIQISDETDCLLDTGGGLERAYYLLHHPEDMFTKEGETPYELIFENLMKGMDEEEIIERGLGIMRKECYLLHNVDILSNCDFESLMYYHQNSSNINATLLVSPRKTSRYLLFNDDNLLRGWVNKDTMETKPAGLRYKEGEYREYAYSGIQVTTPKILNLLPRGKYSIIDFYLSICHRVDIQCYVEDDLQLLDIGKPENLEKAEEFLSKL